MVSQSTIFAIKVKKSNDWIEDIWNDGENSLVAGIMTAYTVCCNSTSVNPSEVKILSEDLENLRENIQDPNIEVVENTIPIVKLHKKGWSCLVGLNLICQTVKMLTGLGDNISSAGFIYHMMKGVDDP